MAEISFPFDADNPSGGTSVVSQTQWQQMALAWSGGDRIDHALTNGSNLPFIGTVQNGRQVRIGSGNAWVGGFYYRNTSSQILTVADNTTSKGRRDLIVIRLDMTKSAAQLALVKGVEAGTPAEPHPTQQAGGIWEMALYAVDVPANQGAISVARRAPFSMPSPVAYPWSAPESASLAPRNAVSFDLDSNSNGGQTESFNGSDGYAITRHLGKSLAYTPNTVNTDWTIPAANRNGRWRWVSPNLLWFQATIQNDYDKGAMANGSNWRVGITLPKDSNPRGIQVLHGYLSNPDRSGNLPNMISITATTNPKSNILYLHTPNNSTPSEGLDGLRGFPARSTFSISGVVETNEFNE